MMADMPGRIEVVKQDLYESKSELVALQCSTSGKFDESAKHLITRHRFDKPPGRSRQGAVFVMRGQNGIYFAWCVSEGVKGPSRGTVQQIGAFLGRLTHELGISRVSAPLFGSDGRLTPTESALGLAEGFLRSAKPDAVLVLHVYTKQVLATLRQELIARKLIDITHLEIVSPKGVEAKILPPKLEPPEVPEDLVKACSVGECVLYAGSGLSAPAGLPMWHPFVGQLLDEAVNHSQVDEADVSPLHQALESGDSNTVADFLVSRSQPEVLRQIVTDIFSAGSPTPLHEAIAEFGFSSILTTNFDTLIEEAFEAGGSNPPVFTPSNTEDILARVSDKEAFFILKLYGGISTPESLLVAPAQYQETVARNVPFGRAMNALFSSKTILFMGCSLEGIDAYLSGIGLSGSVDQAPRQHYALVNLTGEAWRPRADLLRRRYNIHVIPFQVGISYEQTLAFLTDLKHQVRKGKHTSETEPPRITRVELENIGPFSKLELDLDPDTTILVGDNGVGKSSILRAIAASLCADDSNDFAARLVKSGNSSAAVRLGTLQDRRYTTEIFIKDEVSEVVTRPARPLEIEGWTAMGFPAVRMFGRGGQSTRKGRPTSADVRPILTSDPDFRLEQLKEWMINHTIAPSTKSDWAAPTSPAETHIVDDLFEALSLVTPGLDLQLREINPVTRIIKVSTGSGDIRFEEVSQGTASLIGWVAVVLQRLHDRYGEDYRNQSPLILIDEIDAHMHPRWQQVVLRLVRKLLPNAQIIATTHSPLILGRLSQKQIYIIDRDPETNEPRARNPEEDLAMLRADQILTSETFGLMYTRQDEELIEEQGELLANRRRTEKEEARLREITERLNNSKPSTKEKPKERQAERVLDDLLDELVQMQVKRIENLSEKEKQDLFAKLTGESRSEEG